MNPYHMAARFLLCSLTLDHLAMRLVVYGWNNGAGAMILKPKIAHGSSDSGLGSSSVAWAQFELN